MPAPYSMFGCVASVVLFIFGVQWLFFWVSHGLPPRRSATFFYFGPQDSLRRHVRAAKYPKSAENGTFEPILKSYVGVTQLLVTVAAASIAFGGTNQHVGTAILIAELLLAWSIFCGVPFCALLLWRYDEYGQDMKSYTLAWYSTIFAFGFSTLICFMFGYLAWGFGLIS
jgi:hypothetical protein